MCMCLNILKFISLLANCMQLFCMCDWPCWIKELHFENFICTLEPQCCVLVVFWPLILHWVSLTSYQHDYWAKSITKLSWFSKVANNYRLNLNNKVSNTGRTGQVSLRGINWYADITSDIHWSTSSIHEWLLQNIIIHDKKFFESVIEKPCTFFVLKNKSHFCIEEEHILDLSLLNFFSQIWCSFVKVLQGVKSLLLVFGRMHTNDELYLECSLESINK